MLQRPGFAKKNLDADIVRIDDVKGLTTRRSEPYEQ